MPKVVLSIGISFQLWNQIWFFYLLLLSKQKHYSLFMSMIKFTFGVVLFFY